MGSVAKKVGSVAKGALGGFMTGGPMGALAGGAGGLFGGGGGGGFLGNLFGGGGGGNSLSPSQNILMQAAGNDPSQMGGGGGGFMDWIKSNAGALGGGALLGATIAGRGNPLSGLSKALGPLMDPKALMDPRQQATNDFGSMLSQGMGGSMADFMTKMMGPAYGGQLNAGATQGQTDALGGANSALAQYFGGDQGASTMTNMNRIAQGGFNLPPEIAALLGQGGQGDQFAQQIQGLIGQNNPAIQNLLQMNNSGPGVAELSQLFNSGQAAGLLGGGVGNDLNSIGASIAAAQQPALDRRISDLREQFSFGGLGQSTPMNDAASNAVSESQASLQGMLAQLAPQIAQGQNQTALGALQALGGIGGQMGNINTGSQQAAGQLINQQAGQGISGLAQLYGSQGNNAGVLASILNNQNSNATQAALAQPGAYSQLQQLGQNMAAQNFGLNTQMQNQNQGDLTRQYQAWQQQQSMMPNIMQMLSQTGAQQYSPGMLQQLAPILMAGYGMKQAK